MPFQKCSKIKITTMIVGKRFFILAVAGLIAFISAKAQDKNSGGPKYVAQIEREHCSLTPELKLLLDLHNQTRNKGIKCVGGHLPSVPELRWRLYLERY